MARRTPTTVRLSDTERRVLQAAAERSGSPWTTFLREKALAEAVDTLERELNDIQPSARQDNGGGADDG